VCPSVATLTAVKSRITYIESKADELTGLARIGRVSLSKTGQTIYYRGDAFRRFRGFKANYYKVGSGEEYWISGPKKDGSDRLYSQAVPVEIDEDAREEYWTTIGGLPHRASESVANR